MIMYTIEKKHRENVEERMIRKIHTGRILPSGKFPVDLKQT